MKPMTVDYSPAVKYVRLVARKLKGRTASVFNDRLRDGTRSVKVWGWSKANYEDVAIDLRTMGYTVAVRDVGFVLTWLRVPTKKRQYRLHIS